MQAVLSKPPESSTDACAAFHDTACTFPLWCTSVWSHCPLVTSHTCGMCFRGLACSAQPDGRNL